MRESFLYSIYIIQCIYYIYVLLCILYLFFEYSQFEGSRSARLTLFSNKWKIKDVDNVLEVFYRNNYFGTLKYHTIKGLNRIVLVDSKWYKLNIIFGICKEIKYKAKITEKVDLNSIFILGSVKYGVLCVFFILTFIPIEYIFYIIQLKQQADYLQPLYIFYIVMFNIGYYAYAVIIERQKKKFKGFIKKKISIVGYDDFRYDAYNIGKIVVEGIQHEYQNYIIKSDNLNDLDSDYLFFESNGETVITAYQKLTPQYIGLFTLITYIITLPIKGLYMLCTRRYKPVWYKRIRTYCPKVTMRINIDNLHSIQLIARDSYYDELNNIYYPPKINGYDVNTVTEEFIFNKHDIRFCFYEYVRQAMSIPALFLVITSVIFYLKEIISYKLYVLIINLMIIIVIITLLFAIKYVKQEYKRMLKIEKEVMYIHLNKNKLFEYKLALDVKNTYTMYLKEQKEDYEAYQCLYTQYQEYIGTPQEPLLWFAISYVQWENGNILEDVKSKCVEWINNISIQNEYYEISEFMKKTLASNMPKREQYVNREIYSTNNWNTGDVYAYRLHGEFSKEKGLYNKYVIIHKIGNIEYELKKMYPIVQIYDYLFDYIPDVSVINEIRILPLVYSPGKQGAPDNLEDYFPRFEHCLSTIMISDKENIIPLQSLYFVGHSSVEIREYKLNEVEFNYWNEDDMEKWMIDFYLSWQGVEY